MITRRTKLQLLVFVVITLLGVTYVGARYARLDRVFYDDSYTVVAHFAESGGIFTGGEVSYRGVQVGAVSRMALTADGVDVYLSIDKDEDRIPADSIALVGNRSAVGEQYVELQPQSSAAPYLAQDSEIDTPDTRTPVPTDQLLGDLATTVGSVDRDALRTTILELGDAFGGTGKDLQTILDSGSSFIRTADDNFQVTTDLIRDSNTVLQTQVDSERSIRTFARQLKLFSDTLAGSDQDLRTIIDTGSGTADQLRTFLEENKVDLAELINELVTTGDVVVKHLDGVKQLLVLYPYVVEGGMTVVDKTPETGLYDAHFGLIITNQPVCHRGYESTDRRPPQDGGNRPMNTKARCAEPPGQSNARGAQNIPRAAPAYRAPVVAGYDRSTGTLTWGEDAVRPLTSPDTPAPASLGKESWKWLYLQPLTARQE